MKNACKIGLIGAGQLGSRYLQGLARSSLDLEIEAVEPQASSRQLAKERFEQIEGHYSKKLSFTDKIDNLSEYLDIVIVCTNSDVRSLVVKELLSKKKIGAMVLEKVLFQRVDDYHEIAKLLGDIDIGVWVNHSSRASPFYKRLKPLFEGNENVAMTVTGGAWGMACNSLHFIDTFSFLTGQKDLSISTEHLSQKIYEAKRPGFKEVTGLLSGKLGNQCFSIHCLDSFSPLSITLASEHVSARIDEGNGRFELSKVEDDWQWNRTEEKIVYFQSEITAPLIEEIVLTGSCGLPTYEDALRLHVPFIKALQAHINRFGDEKFDLCPIT